MDEPSLQFRRNMFFSKLELQVQDPEVLQLLYEKSKANVLGARYPCNSKDCEALGASPAARALPARPAHVWLPEGEAGLLPPAHLCRCHHGLLAALQGGWAKACRASKGWWLPTVS